MSARIEVSNVHHRYGDRRVLAGASLAVEPGTTLALIGPSGGGKSTLLRCINGLVGFDSGRVLVADAELGPGSTEAERARVRRRTGFVFQDFQLFPHLSVLDNVTLAPRVVSGRPRHDAEAEARALLARVGLADRASAFPGELSGGQKQRVAIARALAMQPEVLLCDEITSALDPELRHDVLDVLEDLRREGLTLLLVTHELSFARRASDRVAFLAEGQVLCEGTPAEVLESPEHPAVRRFLDRVG